MNLPGHHAKYVSSARILVALLLGCLAAPAWAAPVDDVEMHVKAISRRYNQIEAQLVRSIHYKETSADDGDTETHELWTTAAGETIKVATDRTGPKGRLLREYFLNADEAQIPVFVLTRREAPLPDGGTQVDERRQFFGTPEDDRHVARSLVKTAQFRAGEALDTAPVKNIAEDLANSRRRTPM